MDSGLGQWDSCLCQSGYREYLEIINIDKDGGHPSILGMRQIKDQIVALSKILWQLVCYFSEYVVEMLDVAVPNVICNGRDIFICRIQQSAGLFYAQFLYIMNDGCAG